MVSVVLGKLISIIKIALWRARKQSISFHCNATFLTIRGKGRVTIGKRTGFRTGTIINLSDNAVISIGENVLFNDRCLVNARSRIMIGARTVIGQNVCMYDHDHDYYNIARMRKEFLVQPICIGEDVWIGSNVTILRGTEIGDRCVIGAGTVVKGTIPADSIVYTNRQLTIKPIQRKDEAL